MTAKSLTKRTRPLLLSYIRFSSLGQKQGDSTRRQLELSKQWADQRGLAIDDNFRDEGVSAYRGKNATHGALSRILKLIEGGKIPAGSTLLVESLDRLSRSEIPEALQRFLGIVNSGVTIVTLADNREYRKDKLDLAELVTSIVVMSRANEESKIKGLRSKANWDAKRENAIAKGTVMTKMMPAWLQERDGSIVPVSVKVKIVKQIFALAVKGYGLGQMTRRFNREGVKPIARGDRWHTTYVHSILRNRAVLGELTMQKSIDGKRATVGTIPNYYPAIIDEKTFDAAQAILEQRRSRSYGGPTSKFVNLWNGLLHDEDGEAYTVYEKKSKFQRENNCPYRCMVSMGGLLGRQAKQIHLRLEVFEAAILDVLHGRFTDAFITPKDRGQMSEADELRASVAEFELKIETIQQQATAVGSNIKSVVALLSTLEKKRDEAQAQLRLIKGVAAMSDDDQRREMMERYRVIAFGKLDNDRRAELQGILRRLLKSITFRLERRGSIIHGNCFVQPMVGEEFIFNLTYNPYTNSRGQNPLERATWEVLSDIDREAVRAA